MTDEEKSFFLAIAYETTAPAEVTPEEFLIAVEKSENDFLALLRAKREAVDNDFADNFSIEFVR